jgi:hypothetical protein
MRCPVRTQYAVVAASGLSSKPFVTTIVPTSQPRPSGMVSSTRRPLLRPDAGARGRS